MKLAVIPWRSPPMHLLKEIFHWKLMKMKKCEGIFGGYV
ncbi:unnamed protein product [Linum tenue]|uniref:Uncharacterized protein n=1 Tax=Linum tenue TaxID=586396 RepID=A0AAV0HYJ8_9ROSI|nr:unnamed protein product [Linum tenue]